MWDVFLGVLHAATAWEWKILTAITRGCPLSWLAGGLSGQSMSQFDSQIACKVLNRGWRKGFWMDSAFFFKPQQIDKRKNTRTKKKQGKTSKHMLLGRELLNRLPSLFQWERGFCQAHVLMQPACYLSHVAVTPLEGPEVLASRYGILGRWVGLMFWFVNQRCIEGFIFALDRSNSNTWFGLVVPTLASDLDTKGFYGLKWPWGLENNQFAVFDI